MAHHKVTNRYFPGCGQWEAKTILLAGQHVDVSAQYTPCIDRGPNDTAGPPRNAAVVFLCLVSLADVLPSLCSRLQETADKQVK
jgi:hypothetical protein